MDTNSAPARRPVVLRPGEGRVYDMGRLRAVFKADESETDNRYSLSEWWLDPHTKGPTVHHHPDDDVVYGLAGTVSVCADGEWVEVEKGGFVLVPGGVGHTFENRTDEPAGFLSLSAPGGFEQKMPGIAEWFRERPAAESRA